MDMKKIFSITINDQLLHFAILFFRIIIGAFMLTHGYSKLLYLFSGEEIEFLDFLGIGLTASLALAVFAEFFCSILIIIGLGTRWATIPLIVTMLVAAFIAHCADPFGKKEMALLYLSSYIVLLFLGSGKFSLDALISGKTSTK
jgi:putative oxidoreductase